MTLPADEQGYYHCFSRETFTAGTGTTQSHQEDSVTDVKITGDDNDDKEENMKVMSAPCTAVKFTPRVLLTKKQDETETTNTAVPPTKTEMDLTEQ